MYFCFQESEKNFGIRLTKVERLHPTDCDRVATAGAVSDLIHKDEVDVIIGPGCSSDVTVSGKLATYYE